MNELNSGFCQIGEIFYLFWIAFSYKDNERRLIYDALIWASTPIVFDSSALYQAVSISFYRENSDVGRRTLNDLVCYCFRTGKGCYKTNVYAVFRFPFFRKRLKDRLLKRLFHYRESIDRDSHAFAIASCRRARDARAHSDEDYHDRETEGESFHIKKSKEVAKPGLHSL